MAGQQYPEGQRLQGSDGKVYVVKGGVPTLEAPAAPSGGVFALPADSLTAQTQQAGIGHVQAETTGQNLKNSITGAEQPFAGRKAAAEAGKEEFAAKGLSAEVRQKAIAQYAAARQLDATIADMEAKYTAGPGATSGIKGVQDYFPSPSNSAFDKSSDAGRGIIRNALGLTGGESNTLGEAQLNLGAYNPHSSDWDNTILDSIGRLKTLRDNARATAIQTLGGEPDENGVITPVKKGDQKVAPGVINTPPFPGAPPPPSPSGPPNGPPPLGGPPGPLNKTSQLYDPTGGGGGGSTGVATGAFRDQPNPQLSATIDAMVRKGATADQINAALPPGSAPVSAERVTASQAYLRQHPDFKGSFGAATESVPVSTFERISASAPAAAASGFTNSLTAGYMDELGGLAAKAVGGDYTATRDRLDLGKHMLASAHPGGDFVGNAIGGLATLAAPQLGLTKLGFGAKAGQVFSPAAMALDTGYGALYGSGQNNEDRLGGAAWGGAGALGGGMAFRGLAKGVGSAISPTGGNLGPLYENGVYPTIGQRLAAKGPVGRIVNTAEQALQSVPGIGTMVYRAREIPRKQFEVGAFNQALGDIGNTLPKGMSPGTDAHRYMQGAFNDAYAATRGKMTFQPDPQYGAELGSFKQDLKSGILNGDQAKRVEKLIDRAVTSRLQNGQLAGDAYKAASSELGKTAGSLSATEPGMANALRTYSTIFDDAARRASGPEASAALDAVDRGYAKAVRIEQAAAARGGDQGRFSPTQFDRSVQKASGGVRSRAYLRGDALMDDYASAGKSLVDTLPNSGTADRLFTGQIAAGGPATGAAGAAFGLPALLKAAPVFAPYAPGLNFLATRGMAPTSNPVDLAVGEWLKKRAGRLGMFGAAPGAQALIEQK